jgi:hypothetical protein
MNVILANLTTAYLLLGQAAPTSAAPGATPDPGILPQPPPMAGLPGGAIGTSITVSLLFGALVVAFIAIKVYKSRVKDIVLGVCIGVLGAGGFVGAMAWVLIGIIVKLIGTLAATFG